MVALLIVTDAVQEHLDMAPVTALVQVASSEEEDAGDICKRC